MINSLAPGKFEWNFMYVIFKRILEIGGWGISYEIALIWMSLDLTDYQSALVQVMAWCRQATSHLSRCWPRSLSPYDVTRPHWVNGSHPSDMSVCAHLTHFKQHRKELKLIQRCQSNQKKGIHLCPFFGVYIYINLVDNESVHWCRWWLDENQATSHYPSKYGLALSMDIYAPVTSPQYLDDNVGYLLHVVTQLTHYTINYIVIASKRRHLDVITSKWRRFGVIATL